jgi:hypothetical protein
MLPIKISNFSQDKDLIERLYNLTNHSYVDNSAVLEREISHCREIYILIHQDKLAAFFMVNLEKVGDIDTYYLGLSACDPDYQSKGLAKLLYNSFLCDCIKMELHLKKKIVCWWTTATPLAFYWFNKNLDNVEPNLDGNISKRGDGIFLKIIKHSYRDLNIDLNTPYILRGVAKQTNYSAKENERLLKISNELKLIAFEKYQIDETNGDRFLMIGYAPSHNTLIERLNINREKFIFNEK